jgi:hypothetical protein
LPFLSLHRTHSKTSEGGRRFTPKAWQPRERRIGWLRVGGETVWQSRYHGSWPSIYSRRDTYSTVRIETCRGGCETLWEERGRRDEKERMCSSFIEWVLV